MDGPQGAARTRRQVVRDSLVLQEVRTEGNTRVESSSSRHVQQSVTQKVMQSSMVKQSSFSSSSVSSSQQVTSEELQQIRQ